MSSALRAAIPSHMKVRLVATVGLVGWLLAVGFLTLSYSAGETVDPSVAAASDEGFGHLCILCGSRGTADALLNIVLFTPLGALGGVLGLGPVGALLTGASLSTGIEAIQLLQPGRYPTLGDIVWNGAGAAIGTVTIPILRARFGRERTGSRWGGTRVAVLYTVLFAAWTVFAGWLGEPRPTTDRYYGLTTPELALMQPYGGTVISAEIDDVPVPQGGPMPKTGTVVPDLDSDWHLEARLLLGQEPSGVSPVVAVYDGTQREILMLGIHNSTLVVRHRVRADELRFDGPDVRLDGALEPFSPGDEVALTARSEEASLCLGVERTERCGLGTTAGRTWAFLLYLEGPDEPVRRAVDFLWLLVLAAPIGLLAPTRRILVAGTISGLSALLIAPTLTALRPSPAVEFGAVTAGIAVGWGAAKIVEHRLRQRRGSANSPQL